MIEGGVSLADGRTLGYGVWGPPDAATIVYCHGSPGCRRELLLAEQQVERLRVHARVIAFDRPGYGRSTFQRGRRVEDWPHDVEEAADRLRIESFSVLGASGGSPYALACGYYLADRVSRIGIVVGTAPIEAPGMAAIASGMASSARPLIRRVRYGVAAFALKSGRHDRFVVDAMAPMGAADRALMARPEVREWFLAMACEAFIQGGRGAAHEAGLVDLPWGFDIEAVPQPTMLWYGAEDRNVPLAAGVWLAGKIPRSELVVWPRHGHLTWAASNEAATVVARTAASAYSTGG